jgi:CRISPR/Cas system-associated endonuclease Cas1
MERTLYLTEKRGMEVMRDGPSIWVREPGTSGRRIPARLLGRVIVVGNVKLDAGTITLFSYHNIPITFMNRDGTEVAVALAYNHLLESHREEQQVLLESEETAERFRIWTKAHRRTVQLRTVRKLSRDAARVFSKMGMRERDYQDFITRQITVGQKPRVLVHEAFHNLYRETILRGLVRADLDPHLGVVHRRVNYGLALDLWEIMAADADLQTAQFFRQERWEKLLRNDGGQWSLAPVGMRDIAQRFENRQKIVVGLVEKLIDDLFALIRELRVSPAGGNR